MFLFNDGLHRYPSVCLCLADLTFPESAKRLALLRVAKIELEMVRADGISGPVAWTSRLAAARSEIGDQPDKAGLQRLFVCQALARGRTPEILHAVWSGDAGAFSLAEFLSLRSGIAHVDPVAVCVYHLVDELTEIDSIEAHGEIAGGIAKGGSLRDTRLMDDLVRVGGGRVHVIEVEAAAVDGDPETAGLRALFLKGGLLMRLGIAFVAPAAPLLNDDVAGSFRLLFFLFCVELGLLICVGCNGQGWDSLRARRTLRRCLCLPSHESASRMPRRPNPGLGQRRRDDRVGRDRVERPTVCACGDNLQRPGIASDGCCGWAFGAAICRQGGGD